MGSSINLQDIATKLGGEELRFEQENVADLLGRSNTNFPGAQPVSFARSHLDELQHVDYFLCEKTDGIRCLLFLSQFIAEGGIPQESHFLIDRRNDYYYISDDFLHIPKHKDGSGFHTGTLLDGELVLQRTKDGGQRLAYLIFDLLALDGENLTSRPFDKRYGRARELVISPFKQGAGQFAAQMVFDLQLKAMETPYAAEMMFREKIPQLPHGNDGLIFTCVTTPYVSGTDEHILKWKPPHENTIDFRLQIDSFPVLEDEEGSYEDWDAKPEISLLVNHGSDGGYKYFAMLTLTDDEWEAMKTLNEQFDGRIIECYRDAATGAWRPKIEDGQRVPRFRDDKKDANHISTVNSVLDSIKDAVSERELIEAAPKIRAAFKQRFAAKQAQQKEEQRRMAEMERKRREAKMQQQQQQQQQQAAKQEVPMDREVEDTDDGPGYED
ncbi:hypothetical protein D0869_15884 [Hortaea werneckii]|uniref:mRNA-capping enzyme subunit alpha n=1 Tax=Hortaea werneckii TaxID=91943 RepID=A0A3M6WQK3_HORWE|nr:mRNA capping enzyme alpha subunit [Hortaea werneckii]KAI7004125.1 mRNA capping enzyme alpha subunit [Hortaea werneckii]KAI7168932.1 mRNA capping enzyme alpha subunit [Hortaea werneckii]KAI7573635.1 mRNA capping enzyme alpha subunit [Hortaea werneckii]KAI7662741.1 mRNA capping enzyme alpha subunit [Hortaea werneckii]